MGGPTDLDLVRRGGRLGLELCAPLLERFTAELAKRSPAVVAVAVFGSVARGEAGPWSDVDVLVVHRGGRREAERAAIDAALGLLDGPERLALERAGFNPDVSPTLISVERLRQHPWLLLDVMDHGKVLLDRGRVLSLELDSMRRRLAALGSRRVALPDGTWYWDLKPGMRLGEVVET